jgi:PEGA domain
MPKTFKSIVLLMFLLPGLVVSQMPAALGKLEITSDQPGETITIANVANRNYKTPITLSVAPGTYKVSIGKCNEQSVDVFSGQTSRVSCPPAAR